MRWEEEGEEEKEQRKNRIEKESQRVSPKEGNARRQWILCLGKFDSENFGSVPKRYSGYYFRISGNLSNSLEVPLFHSHYTTQNIRSNSVYRSIEEILLISYQILVQRDRNGQSRIHPVCSYSNMMIATVETADSDRSAGLDPWVLYL